jgi:hypothetical protein
MSHAAKSLRAELSPSQRAILKSICLDLHYRGKDVRKAFMSTNLKGYSNYVYIFVDVATIYHAAQSGTHEIYLYDLKLVKAKIENLLEFIDNNDDEVLKALTYCLCKCHCSLNSIISDILSPYQSVQE